MKHGDYNILQKLLKLSTESAARQKFLRGDKDALEGMIKIQENRSIFCDLHADEDCSCHNDLKEAINQKADINHTHGWNEITGKPTEFPSTHHSHNVIDIEGLEDVLHTVDDLRNLSTQKLDRDGSNATGSLASTIANNHIHANKAILDNVTAVKVNDWDNAASKVHNAVTLGSNVTGLTITNQVLQFSNGYQLPTTIKVSEWDDAYLKRHTHGNKAVLDNLTQSVIDQTHVHSNKSVIDGITTQMVNNWNGSFANNHTHNNKSTLDGITSADVTNWDTAHANNHTHANKVILDAITAAYTVAEKNKLATIQPNAQVNVKADWNATSGDAEILNKPSSFNPSIHNHAISDVAGLQSELDSKLETPHLNGFVHDVAYNSSLHTLTFYQRNEPNIVIDLPIEHLIKGVQLHGNDLVFTFEDGSTVTVPLNTLLVGVVKSVNGLTANSQGEVVLDINDIPGLQSVLNGKVNVDGSNIPMGMNWNNLKAGGFGPYYYQDTNVGSDFYAVPVYENGLWQFTDKSGFTNWLGINDKVDKTGDTMSGVLSAPQFVTALSPLSTGTVPANEGLKLWSGSGNSQYGIAVNSNAGGMDIMANQAGAGVIRFWSTGDNINPILSVTMYGLTTSFTGVVNVETQINTGFHGTSADWYNAFLATQNLSNNYVAKAGDVMNGNLESPRFIANNGGLVVRGNGGVNSNSTKIFFENNLASTGWAISQGENGWTQEGLTFGTWDGSNFTGKTYISNDGNIVTPLYGSADIWNAKVSQSQLSNYIPYTGATQHVGLNGWNMSEVGRYFSVNDGDSQLWKYAYDKSLMHRGAALGNNVDANAIPQGTEMFDLVTANGSGNSNFPINSTYGLFVRQQASAFTTDWNAINGGDMYFKTWYNPSGAGSQVWRKIWDNVNLADPATEAWVSNNFINGSQLSNYTLVNGTNLTNIANWKSVLDTAEWGMYDGTTTSTNPIFGMVYDNNTGKWMPLGKVGFKNWLDLSAYALTSAIPTNTNQLTNGSGYITASALSGYASQSWVNSQGFLTSASLPNVSNATVTYQGTGAITGGGSHTINQSGNSTYNFDLTNQTKNEISLGVSAYNSLSSKQDTLTAGSNISIVGNVISATGFGGGGITNISTDNSQQPGPTASQVPVIFTSHEAYGKPETQIDDQEYGNLTMKVETGDVVRFYGSLDNVFTDIQPTGSIYHLDIDGLRKHIYNIIFQSSGGTGGTVRFDSGIYTGDQINITVPAGQQITIQSSASIVSSYGNGGGFECQTHANLIWDAKFDAWVLVSYN